MSTNSQYRFACDEKTGVDNIGHALDASVSFFLVYEEKDKNREWIDDSTLFSIHIHVHDTKQVRNKLLFAFGDAINQSSLKTEWHFVNQMQNNDEGSKCNERNKVKQFN